MLINVWVNQGICVCLYHFNFIILSLLLREIDPLHLHFVVHQLVDERDDLVTLHGNQDKRGARRAISGWVGSGGGTRVDEVLSIILHNLILMGVPANQNIHIKLSLDSGQGLQVSPWDHLMAMDQAYAEITYLDYLRLWQWLHVDIEIALDCVHLRLGRGKVLKPLESL